MCTLLLLVCFYPRSSPETIPGMRTGLRMGGTKFSRDFLKSVFPGKGILPYARFDEDGFLVTGEDDEAVQNGDEIVLFVGEVEEIMGIVEVVKIVGVENIVVQGEYVVECSIEWEVVEEEVVEEEVVEEVIKKEVGMVTAVGLVEGEVFGERHWKGLPGDPHGRVALNIFSWWLPLCYFSSSN